MADAPILAQYANAAGESLSAADVAWIQAEGVVWIAFPFEPLTVTTDSITVDYTQWVEAVEAFLGNTGQSLFNVQLSEDWPAALPDPLYTMQDTIDFPKVRTEFGNGYVQARARDSRDRQQFTCRYSLTSAQWLTLQAFFVGKGGLTFAWTHPETGLSHTVRFSDDRLESTLTRQNRYEVAVKLEEK